MVFVIQSSKWNAATNTTRLNNPTLATCDIIHLVFGGRRRLLRCPARTRAPTTNVLDRLCAVRHRHGFPRVKSTTRRVKQITLYYLHLTTNNFPRMIGAGWTEMPGKRKSLNVIAKGYAILCTKQYSNHTRPHGIGCIKYYTAIDPELLSVEFPSYSSPGLRDSTAPGCNFLCFTLKRYTKHTISQNNPTCRTGEIVLKQYRTHAKTPVRCEFDVDYPITHPAPSRLS